MPGRPRFSFVKPFAKLYKEYNPWAALRAAANVGAAAATGAFAATGLPVVTWVGTPAFIWAINDAASFAKFQPIENPMLREYYADTGFANFFLYFSPRGDNTRRYFAAQLAYDGVVGSLITTAVGMGYFPSYHWGTWTFNTLAHLVPTISPGVQIRQMFRLSATQSADVDFGQWIRWIVGLKVARMPYHAFLISLPSPLYTPAVVLGALAAYGGGSVVRNWFIGDHIEAMAQYLQFRVFLEQGWLSQANDYALAVGRNGRPTLGQLRPGATIDDQEEDYKPNLGAASLTVQALFRDDFRGHIRNLQFVSGLLREPCGWMAIAHKISQL